MAALLLFSKTHRSLLILILSSLSFASLQAQQFTDVSANTGVIHSMNSSDGFGAGVSFHDFDHDGWDDITLVSENDSLYFFKNMGGYFERVHYFGLIDGRIRQALWVDYDNDGHSDLFVTTLDIGCRLLRNNGDMTFVDVTAAAGLSGLNTVNYGVSFADYDRDGNLDFYLARYRQFGDVNNPMHVNALYRNNGDGTFTNVTIAAGVSNDMQLSFMAGWIDYNNDNWPDLMVINDKLVYHNHLYRNNGDGTFTDVTDSTGAHMHLTDAMSATFADFDNDGDLDFYSTSTHHLATHPKLLVNHDGIYFTEEADARGVNLNQWAWGATFLDVTNNSNLDLYIATGWTTGHWEPEEPSALFLNNGDHTFSQAPPEFFASPTKAASYGVAVGDINNDGYGDIVSLNAENYNSFLWQNAGGDHNYLKVTLEGTVSNKMAVGSWVKVYSNGQRFVHYTRCGENYCSQNSQHHIFGLADATLVDSVQITYISGHIDTYYGLVVNHHHYFTEGETYSANIETIGNTTLCSGDSIVLDAGSHHSYLWSNGQTSQTIVVSQSGIYQVETWNEFGVSALSNPLEVVVNSEAEVSIDVQNVSCSGLQDGSIAVEISSGPVQEIIWNNGATETFIQELSEGLFSFTALDSAGCLVIGEVSVTEPTPMQWQVKTSDVLCYGEANGIAAINVIGGSPPYNAHWNDLDPNNLSAGSYTTEVTDNNDCIITVNFSIQQPDSISVLLDVTPAYSGNNGAVTATMSGGTPPYSMEWSNGVINENGLSGLAAGEYSLQVTDSYNCISSFNFYIDQTSGNLAVNVNDIKVFPNPSNGEIIVEGCSVGASVVVFDILGHPVFHQESLSCPALLLVNHLPAGQYLMKLNQDTGQSIIRLVLLN